MQEKLKKSFSAFSSCSPKRTQLNCEDAHRFVPKNNKSFDFKDGKGQTIFRVACQAGHLDIVNFFYEQCPSGFEIVGQGGQTPLHLACAHGHVQIAKTMLNTGLMFKKDNYGKNPFDGQFRFLCRIV